MKKNNLSQNPRTVGALSKYLINNFGKQLSKSDVNEIFAFLLKMNYKQVLKMTNLELDDKTLQEFQHLLLKIIKGVPVGYLLGHKFFYQHDFLIEPGVLIPREDSELLVEQAMDFLTKNYPTKAARIVDLGTGSGVLGLSLASLRECQDQYILTDISKKALDNAKKNLAYLQLDQSKISLEKADFLSYFETNLPANLIISNPPYIDKKDKNVSRSVSKYEPHKALFAKNYGLEFYQKMARNYSLIVDTNRPFLIIMEIGFNQKEAVEQLFSNLAKNHQIEFLKDKAGNWRAFKLYNK